MKLASFLSEVQISPEQFAEGVGDCFASAVRKWLYGERIPRPDQMRRIMAFTAGRVSPNDFILKEDEAA